MNMIRKGRMSGQKAAQLGVLHAVLEECGGLPPIDLLWQLPDGSFVVWYHLTGEVRSFHPSESVNLPTD